MGQTQTAHLSHPKPNEQRPRKSHLGHQLTILTPSSSYLIEITESSMTCGWLLSETIRTYKGNRTIVALKTCDDLDILDDWLLRFEKSLKPFKSVNELMAVFAEGCSENEIQNFNFIKTIGKGRASHVVLCRKKDSGMLYAVKVVEKKEVFENFRLEQVINERNILSQISNVFINKLHWAHQSDHQFYFILNFCPGGELGFHLSNIGRFTESQARFYFCELIIALDYLHSKSIVYNNIKAENIMIDIDGHIKIIDFSCAITEGWTDNFSFCQSTYTQNKELENFKDFSALGYLLYHILTSTKARPDPIDKFLSSFPGYLSANVKNLIISLIFASNNEEINFLYIKAHPWCEGVDWDKVRKRKGVPPFRPNLKKSNFNPDFVNINNCIKDEPGDYVRNFDYYENGIEKSFVNLGDYSIESNETSERNSTDTEDTFNSISIGRSLDSSIGTVNCLESQKLSFVIQPDKKDRKSFVKSVSPHERKVRDRGLKSYLKSFTKMEFLFDYEQRGSLEEIYKEIPKLNKDLTKMQLAIREKIGKK